MAGKDVFLFRRGEYRRYGEFPGIVVDLLKPEVDCAMEPAIATFEPGASTGKDPYVHHGDEFILVLDGEIEIKIEDEIFTLKEGDGIYFPSTKPHAVYNKSNKKAKYLAVNCPPSLVIMPRRYGMNEE